MTKFYLLIAALLLTSNLASANEHAVCSVFANIKVEGKVELQPTKLFTDQFQNSTTVYPLGKHVKFSAKMVDGKMSGRLSVMLNSGYHAFGESDGSYLIVRLEMPDSLYVLADDILGTKTEIGQNLPDIRNLELKCEAQK